MPRSARPCARRAYVAFYVTSEPALRYSSRKQQFTLILLGELLWQQQSYAGTCRHLRSPHRKLDAKSNGGAVLWLSYSMPVKEWGDEP